MSRRQRGMYSILQGRDRDKRRAKKAGAKELLILLFYLAELRPVHGRPVYIIRSALNDRQWNGTEIPAVPGIVAIIT